MLITILATAVVLGVLIFVHELGHFMTAKAVDIEVPRFSIGFGPRVLGFRRGETEYVLSLLPLGGYVKMAGMEEMEMIEGGDGGETAAPDEKRTPSPRDFESKSLPARALVISAGVLMNIFFAFLLFSVIGMVWGVPTAWEPVIGAVNEEELPDGAAALARVQPGARVTAVNDSPIEDFEDLRLTLTTEPAGPATIAFEDREPVTITIPSTDSARVGLITALEPVSDAAPELDQIIEGSPAEAGGLQAGDRILRVAGDSVASWQAFVAAVETSPGRPVPLTVQRDDRRVDLTVTPEVRTLADGYEYGRIGAARSSGVLAVPRERVGPVTAVIHGATETWQWVRLTVEFLIGMFTGEHSVRNVGGPILIGQLSGEVARRGPEMFLNFMGLLSVNLAILNLLPIPVLDGGHLVFLAIEAVRGRALSIRQRIRLSQVGFVLILAIMAFAIGNDIMRWLGL